MGVIGQRQISDRAKRDYELVVAARDKADQKAYADLLEIYREPLYCMIIRMVRQEQDADDLVIEAFSKAFGSLNEYTPDYAFSTWLFRIAKNNCIDFIRKNKMNLVSMDDDLDKEDGYINSKVKSIVSQTISPEDNLIDSQKKDWVRKIVSKLKPHYKILVEKRYFEEMSYEEISEQLNIPLGSVKAKLFRARNLLLEIIKENPSEKI